MTARPILWRCRRGMKELDLMLERFVAEHYRDAPPDRQRAFERLLELPDPVLAELLLGSPDASGVSADPDLAGIAALVAAPGRR